MTGYVLHRKQQSIYDLCLQVYGTLDLLIKFCNDNSVTNLTNIPQQVYYSYDKTLVKYEGNTNIYATEYKPSASADTGDYSHDDYDADDYA
jgi:hypothetical protein